VFFVLILLESTSLMRIVAFLLIRVPFLDSLAKVLMLRMVWLSVSIATFLRPIVLYYSLRSFHLTSGLRLSPRLFFLSTGSPPPFFRGVHPTSTFLVILLDTDTSVVLGVSAMFFSLLVSASN